MQMHFYGTLDELMSRLADLEIRGPLAAPTERSPYVSRRHRRQHSLVEHASHALAQRQGRGEAASHD